MSRKNGILVGLGAALVSFSYFWMDHGLIGTIAIDAISWAIPGDNTELLLQPIWVIVGLLTLVAFPVWARDKYVTWRESKRRRR